MNLSQILSAFKRLENEFTKEYRRIVQKSQTEPERANLEANKLVRLSSQRRDELITVSRNAQKTLSQIERIIDSLRNDINTNY